MAMGYQIRIPKSGKNAGKAFIEGTEKVSNCSEQLIEVANSIGGVVSNSSKDHADAPVYHDVNTNN
jgi:hypothetical protein